MTNQKLILVADASVAHFYVYQANKIKERLETIVFDKTSPLHHDQVKKENTIKANMANHKSDLQRDAKENDRQDFSMTVADHLKKLCQHQTYENLVLIAEPKFLGALRKSLDKQTAQLVDKELAKDLIHADPQEIESHLNT